jgi:hypothetical protein
MTTEPTEPTEPEPETEPEPDAEKLGDEGAGPEPSGAE